jgi:hypothetical protein
MWARMPPVGVDRPPWMSRRSFGATGWWPVVDGRMVGIGCARGDLDTLGSSLIGSPCTAVPFAGRWMVALARGSTRPDGR